MTEILQMVSFTLGSEEFAVDIGVVQEIVRLPEITAVPSSPEFVEGVVNLRGKIIPVVDLRKRLSLSAGEIGKSTRIIVVTLGSRTVGMIVDSVSEVLRIQTAAVEPPPEMLSTNVDAGYLTGIAKLEGRLLILLDLGLILNSSEMPALAPVS